MKELFLSNSLNLITKYNNHYTEEDIEKLKYGLEGLYLTITKLIIIILISLILGIFKDIVILLIFFNIIRYPAFGMHANNSSTCLFLSTLLIIGLTLLITTYKINLIIKIIISIASFISYPIFAPADTPKRPLTNKNKRKYRRLFACIIATIYMILIFTLKNESISNLIMLALFIEALLLNPLIYKTFNIPYNNYKKCI